jgi:hypothetical protein
MRGIYRLPENLLVSHEELCSVGGVSIIITIIITTIVIIILIIIIILKDGVVAQSV